MSDKLIFPCPNHDGGWVYFYPEIETSRCSECKTEFRLVMSLEEVK